MNKEDKLKKRTETLRGVCPDIKNVRLLGDDIVEFEWRNFTISSPIPALPHNKITVSVGGEVRYVLSCEKIADDYTQWCSDIEESGIVSHCLYPLLKDRFCLHYIK